MARSKAAAIAILVLACGNVLAQTDGTWSVKGGYNQFFPQVKSGTITGVPGGKVDVGDGGAPFASLSYVFSDSVSAELAFGVPPKLDIGGRGTIEQAGKIADAKVWSPILMLQYRFGRPHTVFRPYIGVGGTYVKFTSVNTTPILSMLTNPGGTTSAAIDNAWGAVAQIGAMYSLNAHWFIDGSIVPMRVKTTARLSTGQTVDVKVDPVLVNLALGYRF
ncbi:OmpW family protein [Janthinobacterium sp. NKUCC06_STL]|uniref:OmpW/AlkL family protein n=1 Tax=Janthinobacterium sp. NKUCC06_STL TaxID=2842127 RepID=UPI001C5BA010|nr:OmpW family outer membrane protein [Janthinobacterium sp. NKUCC06_STL]MBW3512086.1 outer membrane beta-barrel protein [Janthinobacterium sp. NKUCC06_STL]